MAGYPKDAPPNPLKIPDSPSTAQARKFKKPKVVPVDSPEPSPDQAPKATGQPTADTEDEASKTPPPSSPKRFKPPSASAYTRKTIIETYERPNHRLLPSPGLSSCGYAPTVNPQSFDVAKPCARGRTHLLRCGHMICTKEILQEPCGANCVTRGPGLAFDCHYCVAGEIDPMVAARICQHMGGREASEYLSPSLTDDVVMHMMLDKHFSEDPRVRARRIQLRKGKRASEPASAKVVRTTPTTGPIVERYLRGVRDEGVLERFEKLNLQDEEARMLKRVREVDEEGDGDEGRRRSPHVPSLADRRYTKTLNPGSPEPLWIQKESTRSRIYEGS